ncbi:putative Receptor serine/threonine kinase [Heracleum sosnowskyi]|uniref:Receptor serine/threonine kinase n=1 Tax=Heracleum sosnowskyi TaxID=360622 RepID=A0AAD8M9F1_9APIA|nr:putative Receptor serine/threonine kinase [Heracleum sosnowskyi]KAK1367117.1 putative Receptor serine/threonine kinase [Heracleum sosnowskyi]
MARGTIGYIAPEVFSRNFGKVSSKSDVYSFGMLLLEMVGARDTNAVENSSETYFPGWIFHRLEEGGEVAIQIEKKEDSNITKKLTIVGLWCIGWHPVDRPSMRQVIHMLESEQCPQMPPNPFRSSNVRSFTNDLQVISESE